MTQYDKDLYQLMPDNYLMPKEPTQFDIEQYKRFRLRNALNELDKRTFEKFYGGLVD